MVAWRLGLVLKDRLHDEDDVLDELSVHVRHNHLTEVKVENKKYFLYIDD